MSETKKAVYIGAGLDVMPYLCLKDVNQFIAIDSEPLYGGGLETAKNNHHYINEWFKKLDKKMSGIGYNQHYNGLNLIVYKNKNQIVKYYYNTIFPNYVDQNLENELSDVDVLIDIGHHPNYKLLELLPKKFDIVCSTSTYYKTDEYKENNIFDYSLDKLLSRVKKWFLIVNKFQYNYKFTKETKIDVVEIKDYNELINFK